MAINDEYFMKYDEHIDIKNPLYKLNMDSWKLYEMAYTGGKQFIDHALHRHSRESYMNWQERLDEGICLNYSSAIIDLFNFYLTEKPSSREFEAISVRGKVIIEGNEDKDIKRRIRRSIGEFDKKDEQWLMFLQDADLHNTNFDVFLNHAQKISSIYGSAGVLITKPPGEFQTR